ncbi:MAG: sulfoxide reductase heme-binding subunit YedZ [Anaerolineales bacterium]|nr:sulfoxide reductase heme-binding subunit YedZ [Anaerolineales bacterium]
MSPSPRHIPWPLLVVHLGAWLPALNLAWHAYTGRLSVNPIQDLTFGTGLPALVLLLLSLAVTPAVTLFGWNWAIPLRRWLGLYAFFYATAHMLIFTVIDYGLDWAELYRQVLEKPYLLAGMGALLLMLPLALTSTKGWQRRLGKAWKDLHRAVYLAAGLAVLHFILLVKADLTEPLIYAGVLAGLLALRLPPLRRRLSAVRQKLRARLLPYRGKPERAGD